MNFEKRANVKFCFKLGKTFTETFKLIQKVYEDDWLSRTKIYEWFKRFKEEEEQEEEEGREDIKGDDYIDYLKIVVIENNI